MIFARKILVTAMLAGLLGVAVPGTVSAYSPLGNVDCSKAADSAVCQSQGQTADPVTGPTGVIRSAAQIIAVIAGAAAVVILVLAGIRYITSNGNAEDVSKAKRTIILVIVGLIVIFAGQAIINLVISRI